MLGVGLGNFQVTCLNHNRTWKGNNHYIYSYIIIPSYLHIHTNYYLKKVHKQLNVGFCFSLYLLLCSSLLMASKGLFCMLVFLLSTLFIVGKEAQGKLDVSAILAALSSKGYTAMSMVLEVSLTNLLPSSESVTIFCPTDNAVLSSKYPQPPFTLLQYHTVNHQPPNWATSATPLSALPYQRRTTNLITTKAPTLPLFPAPSQPTHHHLH